MTKNLAGMRNGKEKSSLYRENIEKMNYQLLNEYIDTKTKLILICPNGHIRECLYSTLVNYNCKECVNEEKLKDLIYKVESNGYNIIKYPKTARSVIIAECASGHIREAKIYNFLNHRCSECNGGKNIKRSIDECEKAFEKNGLTLLEDEYMNCKKMMKYICNCGEIRYTNLDTVVNGNLKFCSLCKGDNIAGANHPNWKGGITPENKRKRSSKEAVTWRKKVFARDKFTCQCCNKRGELRAHHIFNWSSHEDLRYDICNGITMCNYCHDIGVEGSFHNVYGVRDNNLTQLQEYITTKREK